AYGKSSKAFRRYQVARGPEPSETLWSFFHKPAFRIRDPSREGAIIQPVLVFDQFEDVFKDVGNTTLDWERRAFLEELAQLTESQVPPDVRRELENELSLITKVQ